MARPREERRTPGLIPAPDAEQTYIVGVKRSNPGKHPAQYVVCTGTVEHPLYDKTPDRFESAAELMKRALHRMIENLP